MRMIGGKRRKIARRLGVLSVEYILILALVVIPLGLLAPGIQKMIGQYSSRIFAIIGLPFG